MESFPAKALPGEGIVVGATAFREGHDQLGVSAVLFDPEGKERQRVRLAPPRGERGMGTDRWEGVLTPSETGNWSFAIEAWHDRYGTWHHNAEVKVDAGIDVELMLAEGSALLSEASEDDSRSEWDRRALRTAASRLADTSLSDGGAPRGRLRPRRGRRCGAPADPRTGDRLRKVPADR